jgi:hypothetical protein
MAAFLQRGLGIEVMESSSTGWVIKVVGRDDLMFTLHETKESALKQCSELNRKFSDRFYVDEYHEEKEKSWKF